MYGTQTGPADLRAAMETLRQKGVAKVEISFSGGNDEGGADGAVYLDANGEKVELPRGNAHENESWDPASRRYISQGWIVTDWHRDSGYTSRPATEEEIQFSKLEKVLEEPIYDRYGSFAGEFHVHGTLTWDVATAKHEMHGQESHEVWDSF
jgi:hypothetical protein